MTTHTLRPNGTLTANNWAAHGAADQALATSDASDASYIQSTDVNEIKFQFGTYALGASERCLRIRPKMRLQSADGTTATQMATGMVVGDGTHWLDGDATIAAALAEYDGTLFAKTPLGGEWLQSDIDGIQARYFAYGTTTGPVTPKIMDVWIDLDVRTKPSVVTTALGTVTNTHQPTLSWTATINDSQSQTAYQIKIYDTAINASPDPTVDTSGLVWDTNKVAGAVASRRLPPLKNGTYWIFVRVAKDFNATDWWSDYATHIVLTMNTNPAVPTQVTPDGSTTILTNTPALTAMMPVPPTDNAQAAPNKTTPQWQLARDAGFTTSVQTVGETDDNGATVWHSYATAAASNVPLANPLGIGTWYIRARSLDFYGGVSAWTSGVSFVVAHPPSATVVSPIGGNTTTYDGVNGNAFEWLFYSTSPDEHQTAYEVVIEDNTDGSSVLDTGKVTSTDQAPLVIVPSAYKDVPLRWKVKVWDTDDTAAVAYSPYGLFQVSDDPTVTIDLEPNPATSPQPTISWTVSGSSGRFQTAYRVAIFDDNDDIVWDTNKVIDSVTTSITVPDASILVNSSNYTAIVFVWDNYNLTNSASVDFTTEWTEPATPAFTVDTSTIDTAGYVGVTWDESDVDPSWVVWRVYRRETGVTDWELLTEDDSVQPTHAYHDFVVKANTLYEYVVVQVISEFEALVESVYVPTMVNTGGASYWLLCPDDFGLSVRLSIVTADSYTDEHETQELLIIGRGRKVDFGTHYGKKGTLTVQLRDDNTRSITAADMKIAIENLMNVQTALWIRTPFGQLLQVAATDGQVDRVPSGLSEFSDIQIPYEEVA